MQAGSDEHQLNTFVSFIQALGRLWRRIVFIRVRATALLFYKRHHKMTLHLLVT